MEEKYVSFVNAKLLKEKHFIGKCHKCYYQYKEDENKIVLEDIQGDSREVDAPTLQMAMDWIRTEHKIHIAILPDRNEDKFYFELYRKDDFYGGWEPITDDDTDLVWTGDNPCTIDYLTPEFAANSAIYFVLKKYV